jgi:hypothetical protein
MHNKNFQQIWGGKNILLFGEVSRLDKAQECLQGMPFYAAGLLEPTIYAKLISLLNYI